MLTESQLRKHEEIGVLLKRVKLQTKALMKKASQNRKRLDSFDRKLNGSVSD